MSLELLGPDGTGTMTLKGDLNIQNASRLKEVLLESLRTRDRLRIRLEEIEEVDLSCPQVLCSAHRSALAAGKEITICGPWPGAFRRVIEESGYEKGKSCRSGKDVCCLWNPGGAHE